MTPLLLIPGMMCDARMWGDLPAALSCPVHHSLPTGADTVEALAAQILHNAPPQFALAGLSMGGIVAMEVLRQAPTRITRLALLDTNPLSEAPEVQARRQPQIASVENGGLATVMRDEMKPNYLAESPRKAAILDLCMDMALTLGPETFIHQSRALATRPDQTTALAAFHGPALVLMGEQDRLCPRPRHDLMHALMPQSRLVIVDQAAHLPPLENPTQTLAALTRWLED
ncbi:MAG: alpha/beta fold hydrolase [Pseudorhodobacter sp.]|nr:alpha/beta fold hydrolase [Pseudorhodobacter sp.]